MEETPFIEDHVITDEELRQAVGLFVDAYPTFIDEIDRVEAERGKLNDFQLMLAVTRAKEGLVILGWDCRKTVNAIFNTFVEIYKHAGKEEAEDWAEETFGCSRVPLYRQPEEADAHTPDVPEDGRVTELKQQIQAKEAELLLLYQELYKLQDENKQ